jgi:hypothetical protein
MVLQNMPRGFGREQNTIVVLAEVISCNCARVKGKTEIQFAGTVKGLL